MNNKKLIKMVIFILMLILASLLIIFSMMFPETITINRDVIFEAIILPSATLFMVVTWKMVKNQHTQRIKGIVLTLFALMIITLYQIANGWTYSDIVTYHILSAIFSYLSDIILD
ncbi:hypothetical protein HO543_08870 [Streptococcus suis]|nr:hypothetical protein [Streptococcus suis]NQJ77405.1 hypothetical protein [Streptococcus suis]NRG69509.1 hypothetical protein [Streptococcus suis]